MTEAANDSARGGGLQTPFIEDPNAFAAAANAFFENQSFEVTVNPTATLNQFKTVIHLSGTYTCSGTFDPEFSGFGGEVLQSYKGGKVVVNGGFGIDSNDLECTGNPIQWDAFINASAENDEPAVWKRGRVIANFGGGIGDGTDEHNAGDQFLGTVRIVK